MFARVLVLIAVINRSLLLTAWPPIAAMGVVTGAFAVWHYRAGLADARATRQQEVAVSNPFSLTAAAKVGALFAVVLLTVKLAEKQAPELGVYVVAALAGSADVDAITLSMADAARTRDGLAQAPHRDRDRPRRQYRGQVRDRARLRRRARPSAGRRRHRGGAGDGAARRRAGLRTACRDRTMTRLLG